MGGATLRIAALVVGLTAILAMVVVGCTTVTDGDPGVNAQEAPAYRSSMSASASASAATSSMRESKRQQSLTAQAVHNSCDALSQSSVDTINAVKQAHEFGITEGGQKLAEKGEELKEEMDNLLDEIDAVLEENAEEFVKNYVQRGGE